VVAAGKGQRGEGAHPIVFRDGGDRVQIVRVSQHRMSPARHLEWVIAGAANATRAQSRSTVVQSPP
jgi:hypothetical protein